MYVSHQADQSYDARSLPLYIMIGMYVVRVVSAIIDNFGETNTVLPFFCQYTRCCCCLSFLRTNPSIIDDFGETKVCATFLKRSPASPKWEMKNEYIIKLCLLLHAALLHFFRNYL